ncbi:hypothetical protein Tco_0170685, partial [Tanacetum coccineum]
KDTEDPSWSTSFKTRRTQKTSSALSWSTSFKTRRTQKTSSALEAL